MLRENFSVFVYVNLLFRKEERLQLFMFISREGQRDGKKGRGTITFSRHS